MESMNDSNILSNRLYKRKGFRIKGTYMKNIQDFSTWFCREIEVLRESRRKSADQLKSRNPKKRLKPFLALLLNNIEIKEKYILKRARKSPEYPFYSFPKRIKQSMFLVLSAQKKWSHSIFSIIFSATKQSK